MGSNSATNTAEMFTEAFNLLWKHTDLTLKDVLAHDETMGAAAENKKLLKDEKPDPNSKGVQQILEMVESNLLTYTILGCLHCYSHSCEHGEYDRDNQRRHYRTGNINADVEPWTNAEVALLQGLHAASAATTVGTQKEVMVGFVHSCTDISED
ncbi:hypothetical protein FJTKL_02099 [Diaporthe vaccinii]|uniref:EZH2 MCSS domain-containing protein n=1 Tax=Diaporthe vaccinii TaxID=105482 RepID=A0ABR4DYZ7_9PEZI